MSFTLSWASDATLVTLAIPIAGYGVQSAVWVIPHCDSEAEVRQYIGSHKFMESNSELLVSSTFADDGNTIDWGPTYVGLDNWCTQEAIEGDLALNVTENQMRSSYQAYLTTWKDGSAYNSPCRHLITCIPGERYTDRGYFEFVGEYPTLEMRWYNVYSGLLVQQVSLSAEIGYFRVTSDGFRGHSEFIAYYDLDYWCQPGTTSPSNLIRRYRSLTDFVKLKWRYKIKPTLRSNNFWNASLDAVQGFHPYDLNLVEGLLQFSMEDVVPKGTADSVLSILTDAVNSKGGLLSPSGIVYGAQIFANIYLYYKYVALGDYSDIMSVLIGDDKATMAEIVSSIHSIDPDYVPERENWRLKRVAEIIVHRGQKLLSSYGADNETLTNELGETRRETRARLKAWPRYYDDMSTAAIICEEFGLSLTAERLVAVIPYEFIAQWFVPIEENIRSIEYNRDRLQMLYKVGNLCLSEKNVTTLDMNFLKSMFGLSAAEGQLYYKTYQRTSQREFPPTALDLNLRPELTLSRVMQGTSLIVSRI